MIALQRAVFASCIALLGLAIASPVQTSLDALPSVKLHVTFKRASMKLHGQSEFDIYATPIVSLDGSSVLYNSYATLNDSQSKYQYSLVDGIAYLTTVDVSGSQSTQCLTSSTMPFNDILPALNNATPIPSASVGDKAIECASGNLFKTTYAETYYAICASGKLGFTVYSSDLDIRVEYLYSPFSVSKPKVSAASAPCEMVLKATSLTPTAFALATGNSVSSSTSRRLKEEAHMAMQASSCDTCSTTPRPCIFFHGSGNKHEKKKLQNTADLLVDKLGDVHGHAPCCSDIKYAVLETMDAGWRNESLQQKFCDHSLSMSPTSDVAAGIIDNTIIVTHSMGGLTMAGALANNKCKFSDTTSWVSLSAPMMGSMASDYLIELCANKNHKVMVQLLSLLDECPICKSRESTSYQGDKYSNSTMDADYVAAQKAYADNVAAAMCSDNFIGVLSKFQAPSILAGKVIKHKSEENDGLVEFQSCVGGLDVGLFGKHYSNPFYRPRLNHADTAFLTGDSIFRDSQKPNKWFECLQYDDVR